MRFLSTLCIILTTASLCLSGNALRPAVAQEAVVSASPRKTLALEISNKAGLVTVREKDGSYRFAQVITTSDLHIDLEFAETSHTIRLTLRDANKKTLWNTTIGNTGVEKFGLEWKKTRGDDPGVVLSATYVDSPVRPLLDKSFSPTGKGKVVIGNDNILSLADFSDGSSKGMRMERRGDAMVMLVYEDGKLVEKGRVSIDEKTGATTITGDGKVLSFTNAGNKTATMKDSVGTISIRTEERDGKKYTVLDLGTRRIFFEGDSVKLQIGDDGEIFLSIPSAP
ncbi:MAG: hypothetical protein H7145_03750 [Akkermansiaceae bacterium]|nr:hypothetical protein [Armatimonadota bacterium]